jgi:hypothetical protein
MTVDFKNVANRRTEFGSALTAKLAKLASVPEKSLRLTGLRSGSIIAEFLVMPSVVEDPLTAGLSPWQTIELLRGAVATNAAELCTLTGGPLENCNVELKDLGVATPTIRPFRPERPTQEPDMLAETANTTNVISVVAAIAGIIAVSGILFAVWAVRRCQTKDKYETQDPNAAHNQTAETEVTASMEEGKSVEEKKPVEDDDNNSTLCPSNDDRQSDIQSDIQSNHSFCVAPCNGRGVGKERAVA